MTIWRYEQAVYDQRQHPLGLARVAWGPVGRHADAVGQPEHIGALDVCAGRSGPLRAFEQGSRGFAQYRAA